MQPWSLGGAPRCVGANLQRRSCGPRKERRRGETYVAQAASRAEWLPVPSTSAGSGLSLVTQNNVPLRIHLTHISDLNPNAAFTCQPTPQAHYQCLQQDSPSPRPRFLSPSFALFSLASFPTDSDSPVYCEFLPFPFSWLQLL